MTETRTVVSQPYPWPWHGDFDPRRTALLVVCDGDIAPPDALAKARLGSIVRLARRAQLMIVELPGRGQRSAGLDFKPDLVVTRPHHGAFTGADLDAVLRRRRITDLIFAGFPFEIGADTTMRQANDLGYECLALADCCTGLAPETLAGAFASIQMSGGIFGAVANSMDLVRLLATLPDLAAASAGGV